MNLADKINLAVAITGGCSAAISLFVAIVTYQMVKANRETVAVMKAQLDASTRPYIQVTPVVRAMSTMLMLSIKNAGGSSAKNLRLSLDKDFYFNAHPDEDDNLRKYTTFVHPIQSLSPQAEMVFYLGVGHNIFRDSERCPQQFTVQAEYEYQDNRVVESTTIDLQPFRKSAKPVDPIVEQLENISGHLSEIRSAVSRSDA
ncbi:hypothetical protein [Undibacterium parvum]|uniref:Uncharacterized protein n=1 Tax=Undibacterium parvum TaxID=401471 RepID=A0A3Q9BQY8_9BURK|nr:hypothetical protein [Undibacterium parvum]AZP12317.1 hypothetical protein EJN92_10080 [Undibacterium parvum]